MQLFAALVFELNDAAELLNYFYEEIYHVDLDFMMVKGVSLLLYSGVAQLYDFPNELQTQRLLFFLFTYRFEPVEHLNKLDDAFIYFLEVFSVNLLKSEFHMPSYVIELR